MELARRARGWRLADLSRLTGISISRLSEIQCGYVPRKELRVRISRALEVPLDELWPPDPGAAEAKACIDLWRTVLARLGSDFFRGKGGVQFEHTSKGRYAVHIGDTTFFEADGALIASRAEGGRAMFAIVGEDGSLAWTAAPLAPAQMN